MQATIPPLMPPSVDPKGAQRTYHLIVYRRLAAPENEELARTAAIEAARVRREERIAEKERLRSKREAAEQRAAVAAEEARVAEERRRKWEEQVAAFQANRNRVFVESVAPASAPSAAPAAIEQPDDAEDPEAKPDPVPDAQGEAVAELREVARS